MLILDSGLSAEMFELYWPLTRVRLSRVLRHSDGRTVGELLPLPLRRLQPTFQRDIAAAYYDAYFARRSLPEGQSDDLSSWSFLCLDVPPTWRGRQQLASDQICNEQYGTHLLGLALNWRKIFRCTKIGIQLKWSAPGPSYIGLAAGFGSMSSCRACRPWRLRTLISTLSKITFLLELIKASAGFRFSHSRIRFFCKVRGSLFRTGQHTT